MRRLGRGAVLVAVFAMATPIAGAAESGFVYLLPDSADRYRPAIEQNGSASVLADIDSITPPALSPDGTRVAFSGAIGDESLGRYGLFVVDSDGSGLQQLTDGSLAEYDPAWSPDAETIAIAQNQGGQLSGACCRLALVDVDSGDVDGLTSAVGAARPSFSAQGSFVLYDTPSGVWRISPSGGTPTQIAAGGFDPTSSPNETMVGFIFRNGARSEIRRVAADGGSQTVMYETSGQIENLEWRGNRIYFLEHTGLGYDGRRNVTLRSVHQAGGEFRIERSFSTHVVGAGLGLGNDEIFFYRDDGLFRYYDIRADGNLGSPMASGEGYTTGWSAINAIDLDGDDRDEMFFYRSDGLFRYYDIRSNGTLPSPMSAGDGYTRGWDTITALDMDGDGQDEIFFYRGDGLFRYYQIRADGTLPGPLLAGDTYSEDWDVVVGLDVEGDGQDEMLFYRFDGVYRMYNVAANGILGPPIQSGTFTGDWTSISAIDLDGDGQDELLFYRDDGRFRYYDVRPNGALGALILGGTGYTSGWSTITSVNLGPG